MCLQANQQFNLFPLNFFITDQTSLLEFLHLLTSNFKTIFSSNNRDGEFIACLTHWLLVIGLGKIKTDVDADGISLRSEDLDEKQGHWLLAFSNIKKTHLPKSPYLSSFKIEVIMNIKFSVRVPLSSLLNGDFC